MPFSLFGHFSIKLGCGRASFKFLAARSAWFLVLLGCFGACQADRVQQPPPSLDWSQRYSPAALSDTLVRGSTYLSVYAQIYSHTAERISNLTVTVSLRNLDRQDTVYVERATYFDTHGQELREYAAQPIFIAPMETLEIIIDEQDAAGGTGGNFVFDWRKAAASAEPLFEAVMISTSGQQGLSFVTQGQKID